MRLVYFFGGDDVDLWELEVGITTQLRKEGKLLEAGVELVRQALSVRHDCGAQRGKLVKSKGGFACEEGADMPADGLKLVSDFGEGESVAYVAQVTFGTTAVVDRDADGWG